MIKRVIFLVGLFIAVVAYLAIGQSYIPRPSYSGDELITAGKPWVDLRTAAKETADAGYVWTSDNMVFYELVGNSSTNPATIKTYINATNGLIDVWDKLGWGTNAVQIAFYSAKDATENDEDDTFAFELYAFANNSNYGPALPVYITTGTACIVGTGVCAYQPVSGATHTTLGRWVDTISGTDKWPVGVVVTDSGNNNICTLTLDLMGNRYLILRTFNSAGGALEAGEIGAIIRGY